MNFSQHTLSNGLTIIGEQRSSAVSVALGFFVRTGARDETSEVSGVSHFLEHMMFKGTAKRSALDITYEMGGIGAQANAYTSEENTVYYMAVLPEYFSNALELLSDMMRPSLTEEEFEVEKKVILEEIALYQDRPSFLLFEAALSEFFHNHPAGSSVLGSIESISALTSSQMRGYFNQRYTAPNIVLAVSGNFDWQELIEQAEQYCGNWPSVAALRDTPAHQPRERTRVLYKKDIQRAHQCLLSSGPAAGDYSRYAAEVLTCILGDSSGSKAYWNLIDKGIADAASIDCDDLDGTGMVYGYVSAPPERLEQAGELLAGVMKAPSAFEDSELERALTKLGTRLVLQGESSMRRLMAIGLDWTYRKEYVPLEEELRRLKAITRDDIQELLSVHDFNPLVSVSLLPEAAR